MTLKVASGTTTVYLFSGTKVIAEYSGTSTLTLSKEYVYSGSKLLATVVGSTVTYSHSDHLSGRVKSSNTGTVTRTYGNLPFGETWYETGTASKWKFTSYERDNDSGLDYALMRQDSSRLGRFMSPDPVAGGLLLPQAMNRYSYTRNDPINLIDPSGQLYNLVCEPYGCGGGGYSGDDRWINEFMLCFAGFCGPDGGEGRDADGCPPRNKQCNKEPDYSIGPQQGDNRLNDTKQCEWGLGRVAHTTGGWAGGPHYRSLR